MDVINNPLSRIKRYTSSEGVDLFFDHNNCNMSFSNKLSVILAYFRPDTQSE